MKIDPVHVPQPSIEHIIMDQYFYLNYPSDDIVAVVSYVDFSNSLITSPRLQTLSRLEWSRYYYWTNQYLPQELGVYMRVKGLVVWSVPEQQDQAAAVQAAKLRLKQFASWDHCEHMYATRRRLTPPSQK